MTLVELELYNWAEKQNRDRLLGTSLTGVQDAFAMLGYNDEQQAKLLKKLGKVARQEADRYAYELRVSAPLLVSTVKPEGTISQLMGGVSSGLHMSHSPIYIRRIRINADDPLAKVAMSLNWNVNPEVGSDWTNARTLVIDFPIQSGSTRTKDDVTALEQLDTYFMFQKNYTEHNSSNTITVRPHEWELLEDKIFERWDEFMAVSFLALDGGTYKLAPYEACDEKTYETLKAQMKPFDPALLEKFETVETDYDIGSEGCESGVCPIR
jgi:ribonucleoside-diphosphate reductase alpha chain/ribonucleoside-triphosphate reductase